LNIKCRNSVLPLVTIGVCVRNSASTIREAIESIMDQDYPHELIEVIFVDDGSDDNTLSIIREYALKMDTKVKIFHHDWRGLGYSRNVVIANSSGKYIIWVDGDMIIPRDHVRKQVEFMEKNPKIGIAKARYGIYPKNTLIGFLEDAAYLAVDYKYEGKEDRSRALGTGGAIYRVKAIRDVGGFDNHISGVGEDMYAEFKIRNAGWRLYRATPATFYEKRRKTWKDLWSENFWHGYGGHQIFNKRRDMLALYKMTPLAGFLAGVWYSTIAYRLIHKKVVFFLPVQYTFKRIAWCFGFIKGQVSGRRFLRN